MSARLEVRLHDVLAGHLVRKDNGNLQFRYDEAYLRESLPALGHAMPLQPEAFPHRICLAVFGGALPEQLVRTRLARALGVSATNEYELLLRVGGECAGAVAFSEAAYAPVEHSTDQELNPDRLDQVLRELPEHPLGSDPGGGIRLSLAGAQDKLPVRMDGNTLSLPRSRRRATTHILKPEPSRFPDLVANEKFCMRLAARAGLAVAEVESGSTVSGLKYLAVKRYDRDVSAGHEVRRLHQEDFCQALGRLPEEKYQIEGGPSVLECVALLRKVSAVPASDLPRFWSALVFNYLIGNCDAHGKNYSLLYDRHPTLAPLYDLVSTLVYPELTTRLAMNMGSAVDPAEVRLSAFVDLAEGAGYNKRYAEQRTLELARTVTTLSADMCRSDESDVAHEIADGVAQRAKQLGATVQVTIARQTERESAKITISDALEEYLQHLELRGDAASTRTRYEGSLRKFAVELKDTPIDKISEDDCRRFLKRWESSKPATLALEQTILSSFFTLFIQRGRLSSSPMQRIERPKVPPSGERGALRLSREQVAQLVAEAKTWPERICLVVLSQTGVQRGVAANLRWRHVDFDRGIITFHEVDGSTLSHPLPPDVRATLLRYVTEHAVAPDDYVIPNRRATRAPTGPRSERIVYQLVKDVAGRAAIPANVNALRDAFAMRYLDEHQNDLAGLQRLMGVGMAVAAGYQDRLNRESQRHAASPST